VEEAGFARARIGVCAWVMLLAACSDADKSADREHPIVTAPRIVVQNGRNAIRLDDANTRIPLPTETGNLIVDLPGRGAMHNRGSCS